jgi:hypothetical protein
MVRLERRRRASQEHRHVLDLPALDRDIARVVSRRGVLFVTRLVLLIDHDHAEVRDAVRRSRSGRRRPRQPCPARSAARICGVQSRLSRCEGCDAFEAGGESFDGLRRERDLGDEDDRLLSGRDDLLDALEVELGFAGAGDAVEEVDGEMPAR